MGKELLKQKTMSRLTSISNLLKVGRDMLYIGQNSVQYSKIFFYVDIALVDLGENLNIWIFFLIN